jgi:hypothetical protein
MQHCACRDCVEISAAAPQVEEWEVYDEESEDYVKITTVTLPLCWECEDAGCQVFDPDSPESSYTFDCQRDERYSHEEV